MLPGTTFSNVAERGEYDSERHAAMTVAELDLWLTRQIVVLYHGAPHKGLGGRRAAARKGTAGAAAVASYGTGSGPDYSKPPKLYDVEEWS